MAKLVAMLTSLFAVSVPAALALTLPFAVVMSRLCLVSLVDFSCEAWCLLSLCQYLYNVQYRAKLVSFNDLFQLCLPSPSCAPAYSSGERLRFAPRGLGWDIRFGAIVAPVVTTIVNFATFKAVNLTSARRGALLATAECHDHNVPGAFSAAGLIVPEPSMAPPWIEGSDEELRCDTDSITSRFLVCARNGVMAVTHGDGDVFTVAREAVRRWRSSVVGAIRRVHGPLMMADGQSRWMFGIDAVAAAEHDL